jgi:hypothetical protein
MMGLKLGRFSVYQTRVSGLNCFLSSPGEQVYDAVDYALRRVNLWRDKTWKIGLPLPGKEIWRSKSSCSGASSVSGFEIGDCETDDRPGAILFRRHPVRQNFLPKIRKEMQDE